MRHRHRSLIDASRDATDATRGKKQGRARLASAVASVAVGRLCDIGEKDNRHRATSLHTSQPTSRAGRPPNSGGEESPSIAAPRRIDRSSEREAEVDQDKSKILHEVWPVWLPNSAFATDCFRAGLFQKRTMVRSCEQAYYGEGDERATCTQLSPLEALDDDSLFRIVSFADVK
ncbi:hypothetical protein THAOC_18633, partial [Thalassiosira oceanica]